MIANNPQTPPTVEYLEQLYASLQRLHRALVTADARQIIEHVSETNTLLMKPAKGSVSADAAIESKRSVLISRIEELQRMNQTLCGGGLRMLQRFYEVMGCPSAYSSNGRLDAVSFDLGDVNLSM